MAIAFSYLGIELNLDAVDEAMRAAGDDPNNARAYEFLGRMFEQKKARRAAARNYLRLLSIEPQNQLARSRLAQLGPL